jgi:hypothetical protein
MPKSVKLARETSLGLCGTCAGAPVCTLPRKRSVPVMQCLEFVGEDGVVRDVRPPAPRSLEGDGASRREPGLCSWCEAHRTCTFPKPPGGVWSCDEFC